MFFVSKSAVLDGKIEILGSDAFHIARSLRMAVGDEISVSDGEGVVYECTLSEIRDERCECEILSSAPSSAEPKTEITLFMAYPKGDKLEVVIQKAVELGASRIVPFESERCIKRPKAEKLDRQLERLNKIATEAAKQCGRGILPRVEAPVGFKEMLAEACAFDLPLFCYEGDGTRSLREVLDGAASPRNACVIVGSEGGFSPKEAEAAKSAGLVSVNLGPRILRCETAPLYALAALSYRFEL